MNKYKVHEGQGENGGDVFHAYIRYEDSTDWQLMYNCKGYTFEFNTLDDAIRHCKKDQTDTAPLWESE